jgi:hypothetical protein
VVIGMAVTPEAISVRRWTFPGNPADQVLIRTVNDDLRSWQLHRVIWVLDPGFASAEDRRSLQRAGGGSIMGERLRGASHQAAAALARQGRYRTVADTCGSSRCASTTASPATGSSSATTPRRLAATPSSAPRSSTAWRRRSPAPTPCRHANAPSWREDSRPSRPSTACCAPRPRASWASTGPRCPGDAHDDGKYLLGTADQRLTPEDVADADKALYQAERGWRDLKTVQINLGPVFHHNDERSQAHVQLCWLALLLLGVAELTVGDPWRNIRNELERLHLVTLVTPRARSPSAVSSPRPPLDPARARATRAAAVLRTHPNRQRETRETRWL